MLKKVAHIAIVILLLLATTGVSVYKHYCGNTLISKTIGMQKKSCCGDAHCNSCHNDIANFKISDDFEASYFDINLKASATRILDKLIDNILIGLYSSFSPSAVYLIYHSAYTEPPLLACADRCARLQVYRL